MSVSRLHRPPTRSAGIEVEHTEAGHVLSRPEARVSHVLNDTAFALWELCDGETRVDEMIAAVIELFGLDAETARREVTATLEELAAAGLVEWGGPAG